MSWRTRGTRVLLTSHNCRDMLARMRAVAVLALALLFIGAGTVALYTYTQSANLSPWGTFQPWIEKSPLIFASVGAGGVLTYAFVRKFS